MSSASDSPLLLDHGNNHQHLHLHVTDDTDDAAPVVTTHLDTNTHHSPQVVPATGLDGESQRPPIVQEAWPGTHTCTIS